MTRSYIWRWWPALSALALGLCAACSEEAQAPDGAMHTDGQAVADALAPDLRPALTCDKTCTAEASYLCVTDSATNTCVECLEDGHCAANAGALGARCKNKLCVCKNSTHCKGKKLGAKCQGGNPASCGCKDDKDCAAPLRCLGKLFAATVCAPPCASDAECKDKKGTPYCNKVSGKCAACAQDSHCAKAKGKFCHANKGTCVSCKRDAHCTSSSAQLCDDKAGKCVACRVDAHCTAAQDGARCSAGKCGCKDAKSCSAAPVWGAKCGSKSKRCVCGATKDCAGKASGAVCDTKQYRCVCKTDADCKVAPYGKCLLPYKGAKYKRCKLACTKDAHCLSPLLPACKTASGGCVACLKDSHCAKRAWARTCDTKKTRCVECLKDSDCTAKSLGKTCTAGRCACKADTDCAASEQGKRCHSGLLVCGCTTDKDCPDKKVCKGSTTFGAKLCK